MASEIETNFRCFVLLVFVSRMKEGYGTGRHAIRNGYNIEGMNRTEKLGPFWQAIKLGFK